MDFAKAKYTAVISDLHLCEAEPEPRRHPLWKKFKTSEFFFDQQFKDFLHGIEDRAQGEKVELVLNGDIFDFDGVTSYPKDAPFRVNYFEKVRGLFPQPEKSVYKVTRILEEHKLFFTSLAEFIERGHRAIFIIGNHDVELLYRDVQNTVMEFLNLSPEAKNRIQFNEWFYISNHDTLIEHGNQYDPYCLCEDPVHPFIRRYNYTSMRLPFGNLACRWIMNGMGFFNPHVEGNYIMSMKQYLIFFFKYIIRVQPMLIWTWFWGAIATLAHATVDRFAERVKNPIDYEMRIEEVARKANTSAKVVHQLKELFVDPASNNPILLARELWLDRAFIILAAMIFIYSILLIVNAVFHISLLWAIFPLLLLFPLFIFYSKSIRSLVSEYKEPSDRVLQIESEITGVGRVIYGHTHIVRHEFRGNIEHLNSGTWSPAFRDVECTQSIETKTFIWIEPSVEESQTRTAKVFRYKERKFESL